MSTGDSNEGDTIDRRNFLKKAAVGAGLAGAATGSFAASARADDERVDPPVTRSEAHLQFEDAPIKEHLRRRRWAALRGGSFPAATA